MARGSTRARAEARHQGHEVREVAPNRSIITPFSPAHCSLQPEIFTTLSERVLPPPRLPCRPRAPGMQVLPSSLGAVRKLGAGEVLPGRQARTREQRGETSEDNDWNLTRERAGRGQAAASAPSPSPPETPLRSAGGLPHYLALAVDSCQPVSASARQLTEGSPGDAATGNQASNARTDAGVAPPAPRWHRELAPLEGAAPPRSQPVAGVGWGGHATELERLAIST